VSDVFISYSRRNLELVRQLAGALHERGKDVFVDIAEYWRSEPDAAGKLATDGGADAGGARGVVGTASDGQLSTCPDGGSLTGGDTAAAPGALGERASAELHGIQPSARWMDEIKSAIAGADAIVVVLTPAFAASSVAREEIEHALSLNKRIVPVLAEPTEPDSVLPPLAALHWLPLDSAGGFDADVERLVRTLDTDLDSVRLHTRLLLRANEWTARREDRSLLLRGRELAEAEAWIAAQGGRQPQPLPLQGELVLASRRAATRRQRGSASVALVVAAAMVVLSIFALLQRSQAVHQRGVADQQRAIAVHQSQISLSGELAAESQAAGSSDVAVQSLLAIAAERRSATTLARGALVGAAEQPLESIVHAGNEVNTVAYDPGGTEIAAGTAHGLVVLDTSGKVLRRLDSGRQVNGVAFQPGGDLVAVADSRQPGDAAGSDGELRLYVTATGASDGAVSFPSATTGVAFSPDGKEVAATTDSGELYVATLGGSASEESVAPNGALLSVAFSPSGSTLAVCGLLAPGTQTIGIVDEYRIAADSQLGSASASTTLQGDQFTDVAFSASGSTVYAVDGSGHLDSYSAPTLQETSRLALSSPGSSLAVSPSGSLVATGDSQGAVQLWDPSEDEEVADPMHDGSTVFALAFSPGGATLASGDLDGDVVTWRADGLPALDTTEAAAGDILSVSVNADSTRLAAVRYVTSGTLAGDEVVDLWPLHGTGRPTTLRKGYAIAAAAFDPRQADTLALGDTDGTVYSYDTSNGSSRTLFHDQGQAVELLAYSKDGTELALGDGSGLVVVLNAASGSVVRRCTAPSGAGGVVAIAFQPNGRAVAAATEYGGVQICSLADPSAASRPVDVDDSPVSLAYTPDGATLLEGDISGNVEELSASTLSSTGRLPGDGQAIEQLAVSPDGSLLATVDAGGALHLWDLRASEELGGGDLTGSILLAAEFSPSGKVLVTGDTAGDVVLWPQAIWGSDLAGFERDLCPRVGGNLSAVQWHQYAPSLPYQTTCPTH